jgi:hypothetical protein
MREEQVLSPFVAERQALEEMLERAALWLATWARASRCGSTPNVQTRGRS